MDLSRWGGCLPGRDGRSLVFLPRGVAHSFSIDGDAARALVILTPGGLEDAFRELSEPTSCPGDPDATKSAYCDSVTHEKRVTVKM